MAWGDVPQAGRWARARSPRSFAKESSRVSPPTFRPAGAVRRAFRVDRGACRQPRLRTGGHPGDGAAHPARRNCAGADFVGGDEGRHRHPQPGNGGRCAQSVVRGDDFDQFAQRADGVSARLRSAPGAAVHRRHSGLRALRRLCRFRPFRYRRSVGHPGRQGLQLGVLRPQHAGRRHQSDIAQAASRIRRRRARRLRRGRCPARRGQSGQQPGQLVRPGRRRPSRGGWFQSVRRFQTHAARKRRAARQLGLPGQQADVEAGPDAARERRVRPDLYETGRRKRGNRLPPSRRRATGAGLTGTRKVCTSFRARPCPRTKP